MADDGLVGDCWVDDILIEDGPVGEDLVGGGVVVGDELAGDCFVADAGSVDDNVVGNGSAEDCSGVGGDGNAVEIKKFKLSVTLLYTTHYRNQVLYNFVRIACGETAEPLFNWWSSQAVSRVRYPST